MIRTNLVPIQREHSLGELASGNSIRRVRRTPVDESHQEREFVGGLSLALIDDEKKSLNEQLLGDLHVLDRAVEHGQTFLIFPRTAKAGGFFLYSMISGGIESFP